MSKLNEVIKVLEICTTPHCTCEGCPRRPTDDETDCSNDLMKDALALLKEQETDISNLNETVKNLLQQIEQLQFVYGFVYGGQVKEIKQLVRCRDCKHCFVDGDGIKYNICELLHNKVQADDWYCADGERKENAE